MITVTKMLFLFNFFNWVINLEPSPSNITHCGYIPKHICERKITNRSSIFTIRQVPISLSLSFIIHRYQGKIIGQVIIEFVKSDSHCVTKLVDLFRNWILSYILFESVIFWTKIVKWEKLQKYCLWFNLPLVILYYEW